MKYIQECTYIIPTLAMIYGEERISYRREDKIATIEVETEEEANLIHEANWYQKQRNEDLTKLYTLNMKKK